jgi:valyl-tRNA synthetase
MKILNASKFVLGIAGDTTDAVVDNPADLAMLAALRAVVGAATDAFEAFDYSSALEAAEKFFWTFCDDYLELVKERAYGSQGPDAAASARAALALALDVQLRLFAPFMPFVTEEVWSWWRAGSVHTAAWPGAEELPDAGDATLLDDLAAALIGLRGAKSTAKVSMKTEITAATVAAPADVLDRLRAVEADLRAVGRIIAPIVWVEGGSVSVSADLAPSG